MSIKKKLRRIRKENTAPALVLRRTTISSAIALALASHNASATILTVVDGSDTGGATTLRGQIAAATSGDTIVFDSTLSGTTISLDSISFPLNSTKNLIINGDIDGNGTADITIDGSTLIGAGETNSGVFDFKGGASQTVVLNGLNITGGHGRTYGGGIDNGVNLTVQNCTISGNTAVKSGGGISNKYPGTLTVKNSTISGNSATSYYGGGIYNSSKAVVQNSTISGNFAGANGGGVTIYGNSKTMTVQNSVIANNAANNAANDCHLFMGGTLIGTDHNQASDGTCSGFTQKTNNEINLGILANNGGALTHLPGSGSSLIDAGGTCLSTDQRGITRPQGAACDIGAVEVEVALPIVTTVADTGDGSLRKVIADTAAGGTITFNSGLSGQTITLASQLTIDKNLTINGDVNSDNKADITVSGGGVARVFNVTGTTTNANLQSLNITGGKCGTNCNGGGIFNEATLTVTNSTISGNTATYTSGDNGYGGGIYNKKVLTVTNSTIAGNTAVGSNGGGIFNDANAVLTVINSTLSGNTADLSGGGIFNYYYSGGPYGTLTLTNSTIAGNTGKDSLYPGGGIYSFGVETVTNTVIANNTGHDCDADFDTNTNNWFEDNTCDESATSSDPKLATALANNGGPTQTLAPLAGSGLINAGTNTGCPSPDQRGRTRPKDASDPCDIGAVEVKSAIVTNNLGDNVATGSTAGSLGKAIFDAWAGDIIVFDSTLTGASSTITLSGGQLVIDKSLTIDGDYNGDDTADITVKGGGTSRVFYVTGTTTNASLQSLNITGGNITGDGGGILNNANLTVNNSTLSGNTASVYGGGISNAGALTVQNSTLSGNSADYGGGIYNSNLSSTLIVQNSTLFGNYAATDGGGINNNALLTIKNSTLFGNTVDSRSGGGLYTYDDTAIYNTVIAGNSGNDCDYSTAPTNTNVWIQDNTCSPDHSGDPKLATALADNGGPTQTLLPALTSGLIDAGNAATCTTTDQIGNTRSTMGTACDIGAVEVLQRNIAQNTWNMVGLPYADVVTASTLFDITGYGTDWSMYSRSTGASPSYNTLGSTDTVNQGDGYWITRSASTANYKIAMTAAPTATPVVTTGDCADKALFPKGCFTIDLVLSSGSKYNLLGYPFATPLAWSRVRIKQTSGACVTPCTPTQAQAADVISKNMWKYGSGSYSVGDDVTLGMTSTLYPMEAFWVKVLANGDAATLLIPKP